MPTEIRKAGGTGDWPLEHVESVAPRTLEPAADARIALEGRIALVCVQAGMLAVGARHGPRALPGEWVCARGHDSLYYGNPSRIEALRTWEIVLRGAAAGAANETVRHYFSDDQRANKLCAVALPDGNHRALSVGTDVGVYLASLGRWSTVLHDLGPGRGALVLVLDGDATVNNQSLESGDSAYIYGEDEVRISGGQSADVLLVEAPAAGNNGDDH